MDGVKIMGIADSTRRSGGSTGISAGLQAGGQSRKLDMAEEQQKRENILNTYEGQKKQIKDNAMKTYKAIQDRQAAFLIQHEKNIGQEGGLTPTQFAAKNSEFEKQKQVAQMQAGAFVDRLAQSSQIGVQMGYFPKEDIDVFRNSIGSIYQGLTKAEQAQVDALPEGAKAAAKEEAKPSDEITRLQRQRDALKQTLNSAPEEQKANINQKIQEIDNAIKSSSSKGVTPQTPTPTKQEQEMTQRFIGIAWPKDLPSLNNEESVRFNDILSSTAKDFARKNKTDINTALNAVWPDVFSTISKGEEGSFFELGKPWFDKPSSLKGTQSEPKSEPKKQVGEGVIIRNDKTGERKIMKDGQWQAL